VNEVEKPVRAEWQAQYSLYRCLLAECIGTFVLTAVAAGGDVIDVVSGGQIGHVGKYLASGLILTGLIYTFSGISGAHFNPAVTLAFALRGALPLGRAAGYWLAQLVGATLAGGLLGAFFSVANLAKASSSPTLLSPLAMMLWEAVLTFILLLVILGTTDEKAVVGKNAAIAIGFTIAVLGLFSSPVSGASMNPARSLGPMIVAFSFNRWWCYVLGPLLGATLVAGLGPLIHGAPSKNEPSPGL
jgi:aquaporin Z